MPPPLIPQGEAQTPKLAKIEEDKGIIIGRLKFPTPFSTTLFIDTGLEGAASMGNNLDQLQPADNREIGVYIPYYQG
ncbi:MAG: hypothetical protein ACRC8Y_11415, partial [Chroococcales cyanobacterium]